MAIPILHGLGFGLTAGYLIKNYSFNGMGYYLLTIFPSGIITVSAMVLSASLAVTSSCELLSVILEKQQPDSKQLNVYFKKFLLLLITVFISASADTVFTKAFSGLFIF